MSPTGSRRLFNRAWWPALLLAGVFLVAHLPYLASTLEDVDSINFALGMRDFDPARHQPHPPGYPIYMALAKGAGLVLSEPHALAIWGAIFGALAVFPLLRLFQAADDMDQAPGAGTGIPAPPWPPWDSPAWLATLVTVCSPLYWMTAVRPMSDTLGLAAVAAAQAVLATAFLRQLQDTPARPQRFDTAIAARSGRLILIGALAAAISIGVRSQALWLTVPVLIMILAARRQRLGALIGTTVWFGVGALLWFVPLIMASGGPRAYLAAMRSQTSEDWTGVDLLVTNLSFRRLMVGLYDTLISHWAGLGWIVLALAVLGGAAVAWKQRRAFVFLLAAFGPYAIFDLLFHETVTTRYALPLVPAVVYLAIRGLRSLGPVPMKVGACLCAAVSLALVVPITVLYSASGSPVSHAIADVSAEANRVGGVFLGRHFMFARPLEADMRTPAVSVLHARPKLAWRELTTHLTADGRSPVWFLKNPLSTDLALIDPSSQVVRGSYRWPFLPQTYLGGVRPNGVDWIEIRNPSWVAMDGWHLTPETAGLAVSTGQGLGLGPIQAFVRNRPGPARAMVGGRHLGRPTDPDLSFRLRVAGSDVDSWTVRAADPFFLRFVDLPVGALTGDGNWTPLTIEARRADTGAFAASAAIDQFDVQDPSRPLLGYDAGWHEQELEPATGTLWRWTSERAALRIQPADRDVVLQISGESPLRYFAAPSRAIVRAGALVLMDVSVAADFRWTVRVPAQALAATAGLVTITTTQTFRPSDRGESADRRALGLRVFAVKVTPAS